MGSPRLTCIKVNKERNFAIIPPLVLTFAGSSGRDYVEHVYALEQFKPLPEESPLPETITIEVEDAKSYAIGSHGLRITRRELEALKGAIKGGGTPATPTTES